MLRSVGVLVVDFRWFCTNFYRLFCLVCSAVGGGRIPGLVVVKTRPVLFLAERSSCIWRRPLFSSNGNLVLVKRTSEIAEVCLAKIRLMFESPRITTCSLPIVVKGWLGSTLRFVFFGVAFPAFI